jgi:hypothetical protein
VGIFFKNNLNKACEFQFLFVYLSIRLRDIKPLKIKIMMNGLSISKLKEIENKFGNFEIKQVSGGANDIFLKFGYWENVNCEELQIVIGQSIKVIEDSDYDDDCGYKFNYLLK